MTDTGVKKGGNWHPQGEDHTHQYKDCVCTPMCAMGEVCPLWCDGKGLTEVEGWGVLQDLIPGVGQLVPPQVPFEGLVMDPNKHGLIFAPSYTVHIPAYNGKAVHIDGMSCRMTMLVKGEGALRCSPSLSANVLLDSLMYSSSQPA